MTNQPDGSSFAIDQSAAVALVMELMAITGFFASTVVNAQHGLDSKEEETLKRIEAGEEIAP